MRLTLGAADALKRAADQDVRRHLTYINCAVAVCLLLAGCSNADVSKQYKNMAALESDGIIAKGWLPAILPPSTYDIVVETNLDTNTSWGEFNLAPSEYAEFLDATQPYDQTQTAILEFKNEAAEWAAMHNDARQYTKSDFVWAFLCAAHTNQCTYLMWQKVQ